MLLYTSESLTKFKYAGTAVYLRSTMGIEERYFYPLIEEKLKALGKVTLAYKQKTGEFTPDFIAEGENGKKIAVEVNCEIHAKYLVSKTLSQKAFHLLVFLHKFDRVLYIAPYEELKTVCAMLEQTGVKLGERLHTADLGYTAGTEALEAKLQEIILELKKIKRAMRDLGYNL